MDGDKTVSASFTQTLYSFSITLTGNGNCNVQLEDHFLNCGNGFSDCTSNFPYNTPLSLLVTPSDGSTCTANGSTSREPQTFNITTPANDSEFMVSCGKKSNIILLITPLIGTLNKNQ